MKKFNPEENKNYWTNQAIEHGESSSASWTDSYAIEMEIHKILTFLNNGDRVLDVGCANGYSTIRFACQKNIETLGVDYIPEMIENANLNLASLKDKLKGFVSFKVDDITQLNIPTETYDKVITTRVIINLLDREKQIEGLRECARVLKPGGILLLSEATLQGWTRMNVLRHAFRMSEIPMPPFNQYIDEKTVVDILAPNLTLWSVENFSSTYYIGTRVLKPLVVHFLKLDNDIIINPMSRWNKWFSKLPSIGDFGTQKLFIFRKKI